MLDVVFVLSIVLIALLSNTKYSIILFYGTNKVHIMINEKINSLKK